MTTVRKSNERGHANHGWLDTYHSFSFGQYHDPAHMGFRTLRVINEDRITGGAGFGTHPHQNMEILTWVLDGSLEHKDSTGGGSVIRPGTIQRMSAGSGITHSEFNHSKTDSAHLLQIWLLPEKRGLTPSYEEKTFDPGEWSGKFRVLASPSARDGSVAIHQDVELSVADFAAGQSTTETIRPGRHAWVQIVSGRHTINGHEVEAGDGVTISGEDALRIETSEPGQILWFDLN